MRLQTCMTFVC